MTLQQSEFESFYEDRVEAYRQRHSPERVWDRVSQPSIVVSILVVLVAFVYNTHGSTATIDGTISLIATCLWDGLVWIVPARLLYALDNRLNPSASHSMLQQYQSPHAAKSEVMRRILGLDRSDGMMASVINARTRALSMTGSVLGLKYDTDRPPGLGNRDNSCYQNSILQGLASLQTLPEYLSYYLQHSAVEEDSSDVAQTLRWLISDLNDISNNGKTLWTPRLLKSMSTWTQQDAQEYYAKILDDIEKSVAKAVKNDEHQAGLEIVDAAPDESDASQHSDDSGYQSRPSAKASESKLHRNPLEGLLAQRVACVQCGHSDGLSMIPFTCLTLSLGLDKNQHDLYERLDSYSNVESIENVECPKCTLLKAQRLLTRLVEKLQEGATTKEMLAEPLRRLEAVELALEEEDFDDKTLSDKCKITGQSKVSATKTKQMVVARPPQSLAVHINRSVFNPATFDMMKNSAPVRFPITLDLGPWCLGSAQGSASIAGGADGGEEEEEWPTNPRASMIAGDLRNSKLTGPIYELRSVVTHYGRHENGHYICYRRHARQSPPPQPLSGDGDGNGEVPASQQEELREPSAKDGDDDAVDEDEMEWDWWRLSDHNVTKVSEETVLSLSPGVFMLFYDCIDAQMEFASPSVGLQDASEPWAADHVGGTGGDAVPSGEDADPGRFDDSDRAGRALDDEAAATDDEHVPGNAT